ncbi:MAG: type II secretion system protein GspJ [Phycisphaerales bacterium]
MIRNARQSGSEPGRPRPRSRYGFTLLELLLAIAVSAMIAVSLYAAMNAGFKARTSAYAQLDVPRQAAMLLDAIEHQFQSGLPATADKPFTGYDNEVDFYTINRDAERADDDPLAECECWMAIFLRDQQNHNQLIRQVVRNLYTSVTQDPDETLLSTDVLALTFRYYDGSDWQTEWDSTQRNNQLPAAVEITIELARPTSTDPNARYRMTRIMPLPWSTTSSQITTSGPTTSGEGSGS